MATSVGLAVYFAERNTGPYHNMFMSFSGTSRIQVLKGETLAQKIRSINMSDWAGNTNLQAAFEHVLEIAVKNHVAQKDMPKSLVVISDMEIDYCGNKDWTFYEKMAKRFRKFGYQIPNIIFWNVLSSGMWQAATMFSTPTRPAQACSWQAASPLRSSVRSCSASA